MTNDKEQSVYDSLPVMPAEQETEYKAESAISAKGFFAAIKRQKAEFLIALGFALPALNALAVTVANLISFINADTAIHFWNHPVVILTEAVIPFLIWVKSTDYSAYNYHRIKMLLFRSCAINWVILFMGCFRIAVMKAMQVYFFSLPLGTLTARTIVLGYYATSALLVMIPAVALALCIIRLTNEKLIHIGIIKFRLKNILSDSPKKRKYNYDLCIVRKLDTGKMHRILEDDRRLHTKGVGSTGGGKTATILTVAFESDLRHKAVNMDMQKREAEKLLKSGKAYMTKMFSDADFNIEYIKPHPSLSEKQKSAIAKKLDFIKYTYKSAGMTTMCPNEAYCDELYEKVSAKGLAVNRVDPCVNPDGTHKDGFIGFSPIYVPVIEGESQERYLFRVFTAAKLYADVNQSIFELSGKGDPYFTGLNKNISVTAAVAVIIGYPLLHPGRYGTIEHVQRVINDFNQITPYRDAIIEKYGIKNELGQIVKTPGHVNVGPNLQFVIDRIDRDFLGVNSTKINDQATGLRNIIDESLMNPRIRDILCCEHSLDLDRALEMGEITLVNFEISLGSDSTGFGMFFMLSFIQAVLRRPGTLKTRLPHFFAIDEAPMLFHPRLELCTTLFRQYNCAMMLFMQSLTQYEKNDTTRYLKNVLTGNCAHQIIFGRASREDMEFYEKLSGYKWETQETVGMRETALTDANTNQTYSHSFETAQSERISIDDVRYREFLECTVFSVKNSTPLEPFLGKTDFLPKGYNPSMKRYRVDWRQYFDGSYMEKEVSSLAAYSKTGARTSVENYSFIGGDALSCNEERNWVKSDEPLFSASPKIDSQTPLFSASPEKDKENTDSVPEIESIDDTDADISDADDDTPVIF